MKKIISKYGVFVLFIIPLILICYEGRMPNNDLWFLLNNGRYVFQHGIPYIEPFTIHEGLNYVMQQWGTSAIFWWMYDSFGGMAFWLFIYIISILLMSLFYKLCYVICEKKNISVIITTLVFSFGYGYITTRPQVFTYGILILEILLLELYIKKDNSKYLYILPLLSLLMANLHLSMWYFQFIFLVPFIINGLNIKLLNKYKTKNYKLKPILIVMVLMFIIGFLNPYFHEIVTFIFKSYGIDEINYNISEMFPVFFEPMQCYVILFSLALFVILLFFSRKNKIDIRYFLFLCGGTLLGIMHIKCFFYFLFLFYYSILPFINNIDINIKFKFLKNKFLKNIFILLKNIFLVFMIFIFIIIVYFSYKKYSFTTFSAEKKITEYIINNYETSDVILYVGYDVGGYTEFMGLKSYMDPRAEVFVKKFNGKDDILKEYFAKEEDSNFDFTSFLDKYKFTHMLIYQSTNLDNYMQTRDDYEVVIFEYSDFGNDKGKKVYLYVRKDVNTLN